MNCDLKPGLTCRAGVEEVEGTPCPGCPFGHASGRSRRSEPVRTTLIGTIGVVDPWGVR